MTSLMSAKKRELNRGYSPVPVTPNIWPMIALVVALFVAQISAFGNLIACFICLSGVAYIFRMEAKLLLPSPPKPFVAAGMRLDEKCITVDFGSSPMLLFKIATFECPETNFNTWSNRNEWLERFATLLGRRVLAVSTSGGISGHAEHVNKDHHNLVLVSVLPDDDLPGCNVQCQKILLEQGIELLDVSEALLETTMGHKWWVAHYYATDITMALSTSELIDEVSLLLTENRGTYSEGFTVISTVEASHLKTYRTEVRVAMDMFLYSYRSPPNVSKKLSAPLPLDDSDRDNIISGSAEGTALFTKANKRPWFPRFQLARKEKLRFGAIFVNKPMAFFYRFFWDHSLLSIGKQKSPPQIGMDRD